MIQCWVAINDDFWSCWSYSFIYFLCAICVTFLTINWTCRANWMAENVGHRFLKPFLLICPLIGAPILEGVVASLAFLTLALTLAFLNWIVLTQFAYLFSSFCQVYVYWHFFLFSLKKSQRPSRYITPSLLSDFDKFVRLMLHLGEDCYHPYW